MQVHAYAWVCVLGVCRGPEVMSDHASVLVFEAGSPSQSQSSQTELLCLASLLQRFPSFVSEAGITGGFHAHLAFIWVLGIQTLVLTSIQEVSFYPLSHFSKKITS